MRKALWGRLDRFVRRHPVELAFIAFTLAFCAALRFMDTNNLTFFLRCAGDLAIGRNPYSLYSVPAPPGLFLPILPVLGVYVVSGYNLGLANYAMKAINLASLFVLAVVAERLGWFEGLPAKSHTSLRFALLLSPVLFFVSFIWVEQDVVGLALAFLGLLLVVRGGRSRSGWREEAAGFGVLAFAAFTYYFPAFLIPTLLVYSRNAGQLGRRALYSSVAYGGFFLWFLVHPGWNFFSSSLTIAGIPQISVYSTISLFGPAPFGAITPLENAVGPIFAVLLVALEIALPILFRWRGVAWTVSLAFAIVLPFLFLNILNGDELIWPLPFLALALLLAGPEMVSPLRLWLIQLYALPMILIANLYDAPGPGTGSGIFYFGYTQFHDGVPLSLLVPQSMVTTRVLQVLLWLALLALLAACLLLGRSRGRETSVRSEEELPPTTPGTTQTSDPSTKPGIGSIVGRRRPSWSARDTRWPRVVGTFVAVVVVITLASAFLPAPTLSSTSSDQFPIGLLAEYPVANGSVTYTLSSSNSSATIAPNYGNWTSLDTPWRVVNFSVATPGAHLSMDLGVGVTAPSGVPYNVTVLAYGDSGLNAVSPFVPPAPSSLLPPVNEQNLSPAPNLRSPQIEGNLSGANIYNGSSFAQYGATPLEHPSGQVTVFFRWNGRPLAQNVIATLYRGNVSYQLYGVNGTYIAGVKLSHNGTWVWSYPRLVNPLSWHELALTNTSTGVDLTLDGIPIELPAVPLASEEQGASLLLGSVDTSPAHFQNHDFWGVIAGPFDTSHAPVALGAPQWCPTALAPNFRDPGACSAYSGAPLSIRYDGGNGPVVQAPGATYWLNSTGTALLFGRLSQVGPTLTLYLQHFSITTSESLLTFVWFVDGVVVAPIVLVLLARAPFARTRPPLGEREGTAARTPTASADRPHSY